eukprot:6323890-Amphidinium_carterae.1
MAKLDVHYVAETFELSTSNVKISLDHADNHEARAFACRPQAELRSLAMWGSHCQSTKGGHSQSLSHSATGNSSLP